MMNALIIVACLFATPEQVLSPSTPYQVGISNFPPMIIIDETTISGSDYDMFEEIARNFGWKYGEDYEYKIFPSFNQLIDELEEGTVDIGLDGISVVHKRLLTMHFSQPYMVSGQRILIPPTKSKFSVTTYFSRFWRPDIAFPLAALLFSWLAFGVLFWLVEEKLPKILKIAKDAPQKNNVKTISDGSALAHDIGTTIGYGRFFPVNKIFGQWILGTACFFCSGLLMGDVYSTLTVNKVEKLDNAINSPEDLKGKVIACVRGTTSVRVVEEYSPARIIETGNFYEAVVEMRLGNAVAVVADEPVVLYYAKSNPDHSMVTGLKFHPENYGIAFALKNGALRKKFSVAISELSESGRLGFIAKHWFGE